MKEVTALHYQNVIINSGNCLKAVKVTLSPAIMERKHKEREKDSKISQHALGKLSVRINY